MFRVFTHYVNFPPMTDPIVFLANYRNLLESLEITAPCLQGYEYTGDIQHPIPETQQLMLDEFFETLNTLSMCKVNHPDLYLDRVIVSNNKVIFFLGHSG